MNPDFWQRLYVSTIDEQAGDVAAAFGVGLELAEFCTGANLDPGPWHDRALAAMTANLQRSDRFILHAPFCELTPAAVDPRVGEVSRCRYQQAYELAADFGVSRMVVHSGFVPNVYYHGWYRQRSASFWREFLADKPADFQLLIENVLDDDPAVFSQAVAEIGDPRARICFDVGHAAVYSTQPLERWLECCLPLLSHVHLHDNDGKTDGHLPLGTGVLPVTRLLAALETVRPTYTVENMDARPSFNLMQQIYPRSSC